MSNSAVARFRAGDFVSNRAEFKPISTSWSMMSLGMLLNILKTQFCFLSNRDGNNNDTYLVRYW